MNLHYSDIWNIITDLFTKKNRWYLGKLSPFSELQYLVNCLYPEP